MAVRLLSLVAVCLLVARIVAVGSLDAAQLYSDLSDQGTQTRRLDTLIYSIEAKLQALYELCSNDAVCASRFYLTAPSANPSDLEGNLAARLLQSDTESDDQLKFYRLVVFWAQQDDCPLRPNSLRGQLTLSDYRAEDAVWWLTVLNTVDIGCGDNQVWEMNRGCTLKPDRIDNDGKPVYAQTRIERIGQTRVAGAIAVATLVIVASVVAGVRVILSAIQQLRNYIDGAAQLHEGKAPKDTAAAHKGEFPVAEINTPIDGSTEHRHAETVMHSTAAVRHY